MKKKLRMCKKIYRYRKAADEENCSKGKPSYYRTAIKVSS